MSAIADAILTWHKNIHRDLPWKNTVNPYFIWVSEIILQQTRVEQGTPYYLRFIEKFPTIQHLAEATQEEVYKIWEGLGYYSRARNMHFTAKHIQNNLQGTFPSSYDELIKLKGVGPYTAAAISSFAFGEDKAVLDGNVFRVLARLYAEYAPINEAKNRKLFQGLVDNLLPKENSAAFNQAIMDFGAILCKPKQPLCESCNVNELCAAYRKGTVQDLPIKKKSGKKRERYLYFLDLRPKVGVFPVWKREGKDIWEGLYTLPFLESEKELDVIEDKQWRDKYGLNFLGLTQKVWETKHVLSHQFLHCRFYRVSEIDVVQEKKHSYGKNNLKWINDVDEVPWPVVITKYFKQLKNNNPQ